MPRKNRRLWWKQYLALVGKGESLTRARSITNIPQREIDKALASYPHFAESFERALRRGVLAREAKTPGRSRGRPQIELTTPMRRALLDAYGETGSSELAAALCGISRAGVNALRRRDPIFAQQWHEARELASFLASELGLWRDRELALYKALYAGASLTDAALLSRVSESLALVLASRQGMTETQARRQARGRFRAANQAPNRLAVPPQGEHPTQVRAAKSIQHLATRAELDAIAATRAIETDAKRLTPPQSDLLALIADHGMTPAQAASRLGLSERELALWCESNAYIRFRIID